MELRSEPFNLDVPHFRPYITAGAYVLSRAALMDFFYASYFVKPFKFDDVYLGIIAKKLNIEPLNSNHMHLHRSAHLPQDFRYLIASHGFSNPKELEQVWNTQKMAGNA